MRIYDRDITGSAAAEAGRTQETQKTGRGPARVTPMRDSNADRVEFSSTLEQLGRATAAEGEVRTQKVEQLAAVYASGAYRVDAAAVSRAMVAEAVNAGREA
jgi:flagellar biosynthesis anti-sigma factor FlgM